MKYFYLLMTIVGVVLPYAVLLPWMAENPALSMFGEIGKNRIGLFGWVDAGLTGIALIPFIIVEGRRLGMKHLWAPIAGIFAVGVCFSLPLFLFIRELHIDKMTGDGPSGKSSTA